MRVAGLSPESAWSHALHPADPATGRRAYAEPVVQIDDPDAIDAFFARGGA